MNNAVTGAREGEIPPEDPPQTLRVEGALPFNFCKVKMAHGGMVQGSHLVLRGSRLQGKAIKIQGEYKY